MRRDRRTREQRKADASARIAAVCLFLAVLLILFAVLTVKTTGQPYKGEPPVIEDKLPGEDKPAEGRTIAVDPRVIPYGSSVTIYFADGTIHTYTAEDCGGAIRENRIDVFFADHQAARDFGVQTACVYIEENNG